MQIETVIAANRFGLGARPGELGRIGDLRGPFKSVLVEHLAVPEGFIETEVFPGSRAAPRVRDLIRV